MEYKFDVCIKYPKRGNLHFLLARLLLLLRLVLGLVVVLVDHRHSGSEQSVREE